MPLNKSIRIKCVVTPYSGMHGIGWNECRKEEKHLCTQFRLETDSPFLIDLCYYVNSITACSLLVNR